jgi:hypothetical protein
MSDGRGRIVTHPSDIHSQSQSHIVTDVESVSLGVLFDSYGLVFVWRRL